jgi:hypothetical protein
MSAYELHKEISLLISSGIEARMSASDSCGGDHEGEAKA